MQGAPDKPGVPAEEEHSASFVEILENLNGSVLISTYQAGQVISIGHYQGQLQFGFCRFPQAMGMTRTSDGIALATKHEIWNLPAQREIAPLIKPVGLYDVTFAARTCHVTGPILAHELSWCGGKLLVVNTLCNCLAKIDSPWSFIPIWKPPFLDNTMPGDRCHLNGVAVDSNSHEAAYASMHSISQELDGWRRNKESGGVVMDVRNGDVICDNLSMPHSPRLHNGDLYILNSGAGELLKINPINRTREVIATVPGFARGLDLVGDIAIVGLSRIRESAVFGGLPIQEKYGELRCGVALINIKSGQIEGYCWFKSGIEELFSILFLPGFRNSIVIGANAKVDELDEGSQSIWIVPPTPS